MEEVKRWQKQWEGREQFRVGEVRGRERSSEGTKRRHDERRRPEILTKSWSKRKAT